MNMRPQGSLFLVFQLYICTITAQFMVISRPRNGVDSFNLPSWMCGNPQYSCNSFSAIGMLTSCSCVCSLPMATVTFVNNRWTCMVNQQARNHIQRGNKHYYFSFFCYLMPEISHLGLERVVDTLVSTRPFPVV